MADSIVNIAQVSVEEYLHSVYRPDLDYVEGVLEDRNVGEYDHGSLQAALMRYFSARRLQWNVRVVQEQRMQITKTRYRIPDTCLFSRDFPIEQIFTRPPLVCIEVLSPEDRLKRLAVRVQDFFNMGVQAVWVLDPRKKTGLDCNPGVSFTEWRPETLFRLKGTPIEMDLAAVFADVD